MNENKTNERQEIKTVVGEVLAHIDIAFPANGAHEIRLETKSGRVFRIWHNQDCCEHVYIHGIDGAIHRILGKPIIEATHTEVEKGEPVPQDPDFWTNTTIEFRVDGATLVTRWIGESNGYYGETVDFEEVFKE